MTLSARFVTLATVVALFVLLVQAPREVQAGPVKKSVRVLYLVPKDREPRKDYQSAIEACVLDLQIWYFGHLKGKTFRLNHPIVEVMRTPHNAGWYDSNRPASRPAKSIYWSNVGNDAAALLRVKLYNHPNYVWLIYIDAPGGSGEGGAGVAVLPKHDLEGLIGRAANKMPVLRWIGGCGHELGHAFGLRHPPGNSHPNALMRNGHGGYERYPACYLTAEDTQRLNHSPFIHPGRPDTFKGRGRFIYTYDGGYFVNVGGKEWEERKAGSDTIHYFSENGGDRDFVYLLDASRKPGASVALPKEGRGNGILFKWQGDESWRKLYKATE